MKIYITLIISAFLLSQNLWSQGTFRPHTDEWEVDGSKIDIDDTEYGKDQFRDLTDWKNIEASDWTDLASWKKQRAAKDKNPKWRILVRNTRASESVGKVIKCIGKCKYFKGLYSSEANTLTGLSEGDEFQTDEKSAAWISLVDGTMLRVSPNTSVTFNEVNLSKKEIFFLIRINYGHLQFQSRLKGEFQQEDKPETDMAFFPLLIKEANREYYSIQEYATFDQAEKLRYSITSNAGHVSQYKTLNKFLKQENQIAPDRDSKIFFYTANVSLIAKNMNGAIFYTLRGDARIKLSKSIAGFTSTDKRDQEAYYQLRGYETRPVAQVTYDKWMLVNPEGTDLVQMRAGQRHLNVAEAFLKRIPTIHLAREIFLDKYFNKFLDPELDANQLARDYGVRLWETSERPEMYLRETFLKEYIRRTETTNLASMAKILPSESQRIFDISYIEDAMKIHYNKLKDLYSKKYMAVREMTENEYYLWLIRNDK